MSFIQSFFERIIPVVKADDGEDELVDPQKVLRVSIFRVEKYYISLKKNQNYCKYSF